MRVTVVDFAAAYGDKEQNLQRMEQVLERCAGKTDLVLFPELCLTGYENQREVPWAEKMQVRLAEEVPGSATERLGALCRGLGIWTVFGLPVRRGGRVKNGAAVVSPRGETWCYEKMHLPGEEPDWADPGAAPLVVPTPWGKLGVAICYDVYKFPELVRHVRSRGAALVLNPTACAAPISPAVITAQTALACQSEGVCIASANLTGAGPRMRFFGGSHVLAPGGRGPERLAGDGFGSGEGQTRWWTAELPETLPPGVEYSPERSRQAYRALLEDSRWRAAFREQPAPLERRLTARLCRDPEAAFGAGEDLLLLRCGGGALERLAEQCRERGQCAGVEAEGSLWFLGPSGVVRGEHALAAETPWGLAGLVTGESLERQFEEYRALRARGARMLLVPGGEETPLLRLAAETACVTTEVPVLGPGRILLPFGRDRMPRNLGDRGEVLLSAGEADRRLHVFSRNPRTGRPDLRPEDYLRLGETR